MNKKLFLIVCVLLVALVFSCKPKPKAADTQNVGSVTTTPVPAAVETANEAETSGADPLAFPEDEYEDAEEEEDNSAEDELLNHPAIIRD